MKMYTLKTPIDYWLVTNMAFVCGIWRDNNYFKLRGDIIKNKYL